MPAKHAKQTKEAEDLMDVGEVVAAAAMPITARRAIEVLDQLPPGKVLDSNGLSRRIERYIHSIAKHPALAPYRIELPRNRVYYGSKETIAKAKDTR